MLLLMQLRSPSEFLLLTAVATALVATDGPPEQFGNSSKAFCKYRWKLSKTIKNSKKNSKVFHVAALAAPPEPSGSHSSSSFSMH